MLYQTAMVALGAALVGATHLSDERLGDVYNVMNAISTHSWENGTKSDAIIEWTYPSLSIFNSGGDPFPTTGQISSAQIGQIVNIAQTTMNNRPTSGNNGSLLQDGAAADPASLGIAVMLADISTGDTQIKGIGYKEAADQEVQYLLTKVPRAPNGAISHRADQAQLWSDFIFMVPPFLAYYAVQTQNQTLLQEAYTQISLYRQVLRRSNGLWAHILLGTGTYDPGLWATGNGWAAYGILRVLATIKRSSYAGEMGSQMNDLQGWADEILVGAKQYVTSEGLFHNYLNDTSSFVETSGAALISAAGFRMSTLGLTNSHIPMSIQLLSSVSNHVNSSGYLTQVTNPMDFSKQGTTSPEGQSFIIMAYSGYRAWQAGGAQGSTGGNDPLSSGAIRVLGLDGKGLVGVVVGIFGAMGLGWGIL